jgi:4'-phosphopantetheinyl transferase
MSILTQLNRRIFSSGLNTGNTPPSPVPPRNERRSPFRPQFREGWRKRVPGGTQDIASSSAAAPIYVWASRVETLLAAAANFGLLNEDDQAALQVLRRPSTKESATAARILLRLSLSAMTGRRIAPQEWQFARDDLGKPFVKNISEGIEFSVSHVDDVVMTAIGRGVSVGVDIESVDQPLEDAVFDHFCHASERETLDALPTAQRRRVFLELWTRKEAYTKMLGLGHSLEFQSLNALQRQDADNEPVLAHTERFYFSVDHSLYHGTLVVERKAAQLPIDIQFMDAVLPDRAASTACF